MQAKINTTPKDGEYKTNSGQHCNGDGGDSYDGPTGMRLLFSSESDNSSDENPNKIYKNIEYTFEDSENISKRGDEVESEISEKRG